MKTIKGNDIFIELDDKTVFHAQTHEFTSTSEFEEWETKDTNGKQNELSGVTGSASANGIACISEAADTGNKTMDTPSLLEAQLAGKPLTLKLSLEGKVYTATAWIESVQITGEVAKKATYSASFKTNALKPVTAPAQTK